jgi:hypothetical protein
MKLQTFFQKIDRQRTTMTWDNQTNSGSIATLSSQERMSIAQKMDFDGENHQ